MLNIACSRRKNGNSSGFLMQICIYDQSVEALGSEGRDACKSIDKIIRRVGIGHTFEHSFLVSEWSVDVQ